MIVRIVKMTFHPEKVNDFLQIFEDSKQKIRSFPGCKHLKLLRNKDLPNQLSTYSHWESKKHLEMYRNSEVFNSTWSRTKVLFCDKPEALTYEILHEL